MVWSPPAKDHRCGTCCEAEKPFAGIIRISSNEIKKKCNQANIRLLVLKLEQLESKPNLQRYQIGIGGHYVPESSCKTND